MTPKRKEELKPYFTNEQLDELSRYYRTAPTDGEGYAIELEYDGMAVRSDIVKLVSDLKTARVALEEAETNYKYAQETLEVTAEALHIVTEQKADMEKVLEEAQQQAAEEKKWRDVEHEVAAGYHRELIEAQQTIARQGEIIHGIDRDLTKLRMALVSIANDKAGEVSVWSMMLANKARAALEEGETQP